MRGEILTGADRRRRWSQEEKINILREAFAPGAVVTDVARRHDLRPQQLYQWRDTVLAERQANIVGDVDFEGFVPVTVAPEPCEKSAASVQLQPALAACVETIEITLTGGRILRLPASSSGETLSRVIRAVESV